MTVEIDPGLLATTTETPALAESASVARRRVPVMAKVAGGFLLLLIVAAVLADLLPLADPQGNIGDPRTKPFTSWPEWLGTDRFGRSQLSRVIFGARVSLTAGVSATALAFVLGVPIGVLAGFRQRRTDAVVSLFTDALLAFPGLVVLIALAALFSPGLATIVIGLAIIALPSMVRLSRGNALRVSKLDFVAAARVSGLRNRTIVLREILPNVVAPVASYALAITAVLIVAETSASYLGVGVKATTPSWGAMIFTAQPDLERYPYLVGVPAAVLFVTVMCMNVVGEYVRTRNVT